MPLLNAPENTNEISHEGVLITVTDGQVEVDGAIAEVLVRYHGFTYDEGEPKAGLEAPVEPPVVDPAAEPEKAPEPEAPAKEAETEGEKEEPVLEPGPTDEPADEAEKQPGDAGGESAE